MELRRCSIFTGIVFNHVPTLEEVIKGVDWGSNREIRHVGFRLDLNFNWEVSPFFSQKIKDMVREHDPKRLIPNGTAVLVSKGDKLIVVLVEEE